MLKFVRDNAWLLVGFLCGVLVGVLGVYQEHWLGPYSAGILVGGGVAFALLMVFAVASEVRNVSEAFSVFVLAVPVVLAVVMRREESRPGVRVFQPVINFPTITTEQVLLWAGLAAVLVLAIALARSFARGEVIAIESHWGGLGGGLGGWRISVPLVYLIGILAISVTLAADAWHLKVVAAAPGALGEKAAAQKNPSSTPPSTEH